MTLRKLTALALTLFALAPVLAAGRPACCVKQAAPVARGCCSAMTSSAPKGCCKPPQAPKPETRAKADAVLVPSAAPAMLASTEVVDRATDAEVALVARLEHRAPSPADSPPDRLALHRTLLI